ncbi:hypothetical protein JTB14_034176 [Gonioctena quinquepunctata]|nr:hypothetical protein JTB14_034176 [Gonioctena quinquepunctata]
MANILVTGFGPFGGHKVNASWQAVKLLPDEIPNEYHKHLPFGGFKLIKKEVPVEYMQVEKEVPSLWQEFDPILVIHVGVHNSDTVKIEICAKRGDYNKTDQSGQKHPTGLCCATGETYINTKLDVGKICATLKETGINDVETSLEAGLYLCEFIYFLSLKEDNKRTLFIHVPTLDKLTAEEMAERLLKIIKCALDQVDPPISTTNTIKNPEEISRNQEVS